MTDMKALFGSMVFNEVAMEKYLPAEAFAALRATRRENRPLDPALADEIAEAMKTWALERGATHYTHWFQPLTGVTAEKHESFISPKRNGSITLEFSGKELRQGESDASSLPSGGLRATFEARGYTAWDPTSYAFIKDGTLCIPTAFCSYTGEALDTKTPLLRSMQALDREACRVLAALGTPAGRVYPSCGAEQEYFLIDREAYNKRRDLVYTGRTLFGARPPKGQEKDDHYYGSIKIRVSAYMKELDEELWKLGVLAKTEHNEAAPAQHELAPVHTIANVACDHNQITMEIMRKVAKRHGLTCLLHEKPFAGVNGSGKHNNWSLATDTGENLLEPGATPAENARFLLFFCAVLQAVDDYQELLRISVITAGNDYRLGANEAPPAVMSVFVGDEMQSILDAMAQGKSYNGTDKKYIQAGVDTLPAIPRDATDRNRTSPFAFSGNKFEFRMPGSSSSISEPNTVLNTIVAESLRQYADRLEASDDKNRTMTELICETIRNHRRIIFNGNGYDAAWMAEAKRRGLSNLPTAADAIPHLVDEKNLALLSRHGIYTKKELASRCEIMLENYCKTVNVEARTMLEMARRQILPAVLGYQRELAETVNEKTKISGFSCRTEKELLGKISGLTDDLYVRTGFLESAAEEALAETDMLRRAALCRDRVLPAMAQLREPGDELEQLCPANQWPLPTYGMLMYRV